MNKTATYYRIDRRLGTKLLQWEALPEKYASEDEARLAFADTTKFPDPFGLRVVRVTEEVVFQ